MATNELMPSVEKLVPLPKAKSAVWKYYGFIVNASGKIEDRKKVFCKLCDPPFALAYSTNTSNLTYHLERKHPEEHRKVLRSQGKDKKDLQPKTICTTPPFLSINSASQGVKPYDKSSKRAKQLVNATAEFVSLSLQPIRIVDDPSFRNLLTIADPRFDIPHRTHFSTKVIPDLYYSVRGQIESQLASINYCTVTTDLWTSSHQHRSYISLTVHFVNSQSYVLNSLCLQTLEVPQDHTANSLHNVLLSMFKDWNISTKMFAATTDNGHNIMNAIELLTLEHFPCLAHILQLAIKKAYNLPKVHTTIARCKKLVEHFNKSTKETYKLREKQKMLELKEHKLIQDCPTRWGSTLSMLKRVSEQQAAIAAVLIEGKVQHLMPEGEEWSIIDELIKILEPFQEATEVMSTEKFPSISSVKPLLYKLLEKTLMVNSDDKAVTKSMKEVVKADLSSRYQTNTIKNLLDIAAILDPRYKELPFLSNAETKDIFDHLEQVLIAMNLSQDTEDSQQIQLDSDEDDQNSPSERPAKRPKNSELSEESQKETRFSKLLGDLFHNETVPQRLAITDKVTREISLYKAERTADLDSDPLKWWNDRKHTYPLITKLVQKTFSMVATSVPSERLFSSSGNIITEKRSCLLPENADKLIFLHENIRKL